MSKIVKGCVVLGCGFPGIVMGIGLISSMFSTDTPSVQEPEFTKEDGLVLLNGISDVEKTLKQKNDICNELINYWMPGGVLVGVEKLHLHKEKCHKIRSDYNAAKVEELVKLKEDFASRSQSLLGKMKKACDEVTKSCTYSPKYSPKYINTRTAVYPYFGIDADGTFLAPALKLQTRRSQWLFWDTVIFSSETNYTVSGLKPEHHVSDDAKVSEYDSIVFAREDLKNFSKSASKPFIDVLKEQFSDPNGIIRFQGKFTYDYKMKASEKKANLKFLEMYEELDSMYQKIKDGGN